MPHQEGITCVEKIAGHDPDIIELWKYSAVLIVHQKYLLLE